MSSRRTRRTVGVLKPLTAAQKAVRRAQAAANRAKAQERTTALLRALQAAGVPITGFVREWPFFGQKTSRPWHFDLADPQLKIAIEIDGGEWIGGRHNFGDRKSERDKLNWAQAHGWIVLTFAQSMVRDYLAECVAVTKEAFLRRRT